MKQYLFVIVGIVTIVVLFAAGGGQISPPYNPGGGGAPIASPTFTGIATAPTFNYTTSLTKNGSAVLAVNGCATITTTTATSYTCTITGGTSSSICWYAPTNLAAASLVQGNSISVLLGNIPFISISGTTAMLTFRAAADTVVVTAGSTFSMSCSV